MERSDMATALAWLALMERRRNQRPDLTRAASEKLVGWGIECRSLGGLLYGGGLELPDPGFPQKRMPGRLLYRISW